MDATPNETWKPVVGYEDLYEVSDQGRVRSLDRPVRVGHGAFRIRRGRILKQTTTPYGYFQVTLSRSGKVRPTVVHRLVLEAFHPRPLGMYCCHINDVKTDNRLENLRWGSQSDNMQDCVRNGGHFQASQTHCKRGHEFTPENTVIETTGSRRCQICRRNYSREYKARRLAARGAVLR